MRILRAIRNRGITLARYASVAPGIKALPVWVFLGALQSRLLGGPGHLEPSGSGHRDLRVPIGRIRGQDVIVDTSSLPELGVFQEVLVDRIYPLDRLPFVPAMVLDCGANIGYFASLCRVRFPEAEIICWEPDPHNFSRLLTQPLLRTDSVRLHQAAVSDCNGKATLSGHDTGCALSVSDAGGESRQVDTVDLSTWIKENARFPLLVKMDIEGHETVVVKSLREAWHAPSVLFLETHADRGLDHDLLTGLEYVGFQMELLRVHELPGDPRIFKEYVGHYGARMRVEKSG